MKVFVKAIEKEVERQIKLSDKKKPVKMEVRNVLPDATTEFMRPLPGSARMYPETDLPILKIHRDLINEAKKTLPKLRSEEEKDLVKKGLNVDMIKLLFKQNKLVEFKELLKEIDKPQLIAKVLLMYPKEIAKREEISLGKVDELFTLEVLSFVLDNLRKKKISESDIKHVLERVARGEDVHEAVKVEKADTGDVEDKIRKIVKSKPDLSENAYMGLVMKELKGKVDGKTAMEIIRKYVK